MKRITDRYIGCSTNGGRTLDIIGERSVIKVGKRDMVRLGNTAVAFHGKFALVDLRWLNKELAELKQLRESKEMSASGAALLRSYRGAR